ncbi:hypothetical protein [Streptosporangium sandarakinum]
MSLPITPAFRRPIRLTAAKSCPRCRTALTGGPVLYHCGPCSRAVYAADLNAEFTPRRPR